MTRLLASVAALALVIEAAFADPLRFQSRWLDPGGGSGDTPIAFEPAGETGAAESGPESGPWIGRYPFGGGAVYGCYDAASRAFTGVWTQESLSVPCDDTRFGAAIWGEIRLEFDADLESFEGWYNFCGEPERYGWSGQRAAGLGAVTGGEIRGAPSCGPDLMS